MREAEEHTRSRICAAEVARLELEERARREAVMEFNRRARDEEERERKEAAAANQARREVEAQERKAVEERMAIEERARRESKERRRTQTEERARMDVVEEEEDDDEEEKEEEEDEEPFVQSMAQGEAVNSGGSSDDGSEDCKEEEEDEEPLAACLPSSQQNTRAGVRTAVQTGSKNRGLMKPSSTGGLFKQARDRQVASRRESTAKICRTSKCVKRTTDESGHCILHRG
jgi:hypothetical protein